MQEIRYDKDREWYYFFDNNEVCLIEDDTTPKGQHFANPRIIFTWDSYTNNRKPGSHVPLVPLSNVPQHIQDLVGSRLAAFGVANAKPSIMDTINYRMPYNTFAQTYGPLIDQLLTEHKAADLDEFVCWDLIEFYMYEGIPTTPQREDELHEIVLQKEFEDHLNKYLKNHSRVILIQDDDPYTHPFFDHA